VSSNLCALHSTSSVYHSRSFFSRANRRVFNRLERFSKLTEVFGELSKNIELSTFLSTLRFAYFLPANPNPFISLRGSKEPQGHPTRAKPLVNLLIRTAQKLKITKRPFGRGALSSSKNLPSARTPLASINCSNLGSDSVRPKLQACQPRSNAWTALRHTSIASISKKPKPEEPISKARSSAT